MHTDGPLAKSQIQACMMDHVHDFMGKLAKLILPVVFTTRLHLIDGLFTKS